MAANSVYGGLEWPEAFMVVLCKHEDDSFKNESARVVAIDPLG